MTYTDAIIYIPSMSALIGWLEKNKPSYLAQDANGKISSPPTVVGLARTPTVINGDTGLAYVRMTPDEVTTFTAAPITILAQTPYVDTTTPDTLYAALFADATAKASYDAVYPRTPITVTNPDGTTTTITPPERFGQMG